MDEVGCLGYVWACCGPSLVWVVNLRVGVWLLGPLMFGYGSGILVVGLRLFGLCFNFGLDTHILVTVLESSIANV